MSFYFNSLSEFLWMDGHGPFVWVCYVSTIAIFIGLALAPRMRKAKFIKQQCAIVARQQSRSEV